MPSALAFLASKGLVLSCVASQGGAFLGLQMPFASVVAHTPTSGVSRSGPVHIHAPTLDSQGGPRSPSVEFPRVGARDPILDSRSQRVPSLASPRSIKSPLPSRLVCPTRSSKARSVAPTLDGCGQHGPSSASSRGVDRPSPSRLVDTSCSGNALGTGTRSFGSSRRVAFRVRSPSLAFSGSNGTEMKYGRTTAVYGRNATVNTAQSRTVAVP
jgi:hypothetical protein